MTITRQHSETELTELVGKSCNELSGVGSSFSGGFSTLFISASEGTYRFFIDEGILFLEEAQQEPSEDLDEGERYIDILSCLKISSPTDIVKIIMKDSVLVIHLVSGIIQLKNDDSMTYAKRL